MSKAHHCCGTCGSGVGRGLYMRMPCVHLSERKKKKKNKKIRKMGWERGERVGAKEPPMAVSEYLGSTVSLEPSDCEPR